MWFLKIALMFLLVKISIDQNWRTKEKAGRAYISFQPYVGLSEHWDDLDETGNRCLKQF